MLAYYIPLVVACVLIIVAGLFRAESKEILGMTLAATVAIFLTGAVLIGNVAPTTAGDLQEIALHGEYTKKGMVNCHYEPVNNGNIKEMWTTPGHCSELQKIKLTEKSGTDDDLKDFLLKMERIRNKYIPCQYVEYNGKGKDVFKTVQMPIDDCVKYINIQAEQEKQFKTIRPDK